MDEIVQKMGFDASSAIKSATDLNRRLLTMEKRLLAVANAASRFNSAGTGVATTLDKTTQSATGATTSLQKFGRQGSRSFSDLERRAASFAVSMETLSRVVATQFIVRGLTAVRGGIEDSLQGFEEYSRRLSEIGTIGDQSFSRLSAELRGLSNEFNADLIDTAAAKYQILSSNFEGAAESSQILSAALKFSKIAIADVESSGDLLASTLNAYGKSAEDAEQVSAQLFKAIELAQ